MLRKYDTILYVFCALMAISIASAGNLVPCPDCRKSVSPRAIFCPSCGCPGEAIAAAATNSVDDNVKAPDRLIKIEADGRSGFAFPVEMADGLFAVAPLEFLLSADSVALSFLSTNAPIVYAMPEVALDVPLVRFPVTETNLAYWCAAPLASQGTANLDFSTVTGITFAREVTPRSLAAVSAATNLVSLFITASGSRTAQRLNPEQKWKKIQPKIFREQSRVFEKRIRGEEAPLPEMWCHPIFEALLKRNQAKEK